MFGLFKRRRKPVVKDSQEAKQIADLLKTMLSEKKGKVMSFDAFLSDD